MSKKAASWAAAAMTLFVTLLLGAVLLRPILAESSDTPATAPSGVTVVDDVSPVGEGYEYDDDDYEDDDDYDDDEHEDDDHEDDDRYEDEHDDDDD